RDAQLRLEPLRECLPQRPVPARREGEVGPHEAIELRQRLLVEADVVEIPGAATRGPETIVDGAVRKPLVVLAPGKPRLLRRGLDVAVAQHRGGAVVIEGGDPEDERHGTVSAIACAIRKLPRSAKWQPSRKMSWVAGT